MLVELFRHHLKLFRKYYSKFESNLCQSEFWIVSSGPIERGIFMFFKLFRYNLKLIISYYFKVEKTCPESWHPVNYLQSGSRSFE